MLVTAIWLAGCASQGNVDRDKLSELAVGRTTSAELAGSWGPPLTKADRPEPIPKS
jgi:hypothetical protein